MPPISHGSFVTGEFIQNWNYVKDGYPYIIVTKEDGIVFKIVYNKIKRNKTFLLCSTNTAFKPYEVKVDDILEIWKFTNYINSDAPEFKLQD